MTEQKPFGAGKLSPPPTLAIALGDKLPPARRLSVSSGDSGKEDDLLGLDCKPLFYRTHRNFTCGQWTICFAVQNLDIFPLRECQKCLSCQEILQVIRLLELYLLPGHSHNYEALWVQGTSLRRAQKSKRSGSTGRVIGSSKFPVKSEQSQIYLEGQWYVIAVENLILNVWWA